MLLMFIGFLIDLF